MHTVIEVLAALHDLREAAMADRTRDTSDPWLRGWNTGRATAYDVAIKLLSDLPLMAGRDR